MTTPRAGAALVIGVVLGSLAAPAAATWIQGAPAPATTKAAPSGGTLELTGVYRGYSGKWMSVWTDDGRRLRFTVDDRGVPDWRKRFKFGERVVVTYRDLGSRQLPLVVGMKRAEGASAKKPAP